MLALLKLFTAFFKVGALTFGGGYAILPILQKEVVEKNNYATWQEVCDYYAVAQCLPGIIAVNTSILIGYKYKGVGGAVAAAFGVVFPSLIIILSIAKFIQNFSHISYVSYAFSGIRVAVCALIIEAVIKMWKSGVIDWKCIILCLVSVASLIFFKASPMLLVVFAIASGILIKSFERKRSI